MPNDSHPLKRQPFRKDPPPNKAAGLMSSAPKEERRVTTANKQSPINTQSI